jgi:hypothetical protein
VSVATVGMVRALVFGQRVAVASREVGFLARRLDQDGASGHAAERAPAEMAQVAEELQMTFEVRLPASVTEVRPDDTARSPWR